MNATLQLIMAMLHTEYEVIAFTVTENFAKKISIVHIGKNVTQHKQEVGARQVLN